MSSQVAACPCFPNTAAPRLLNHALQPLRACAPAIAHEYARRARALRMPGRSAARAAAAALFGTVGHNGNLAAARQTRPLDTFFPFDPYLLRHSAAQLELRRSYIRCAGARSVSVPGLRLTAVSDGNRATRTSRRRLSTTATAGARRAGWTSAPVWRMTRTASSTALPCTSASPAPRPWWRR